MAEAANVSQSSRSSSPVPPVSRERALLESFFHALSQFAFEKAKDQVEKERDAKKTPSAYNNSSSALWQSFMNILSHLASAEKIYFSLSFITKKLFRKDFARDNYRVLLSELKKTEETAQSSHTMSIPPVECSLLTEVCRHLSQFAQARLEIIDFYENMASVGVLAHVNYADLVSIIEEIIEKYQKSFHHPILDPIKSSFSFEVEILHHCLQAQCDMSEWKFLSSLLHLNESNTKLSTWGQLLPNLSSKELSASLSIKKSIFSSAPKKQAEAPFLYLWLSKLQASLVSKFTLYFYTILSAQTTQAEMKTLTARATTDYIAKINAFQRRSDAINISILFDAQRLDSYRGHGYHFPQDKMDQPAGLGAFPAIVSLPGERPVEHWPNIISIIMDKNHGHDLTFTDKIVYFFDNTSIAEASYGRAKPFTGQLEISAPTPLSIMTNIRELGRSLKGERVQSTYFLTRIDYRMTLVITFLSKKAEKDSYVTTFMNDIACHLRNTKIFSILKQGT